MNIIINNAEEAKEYIDKTRGYIIAELMYSQLMKQPEDIRIKLYERLVMQGETGSPAK